MRCEHEFEVCFFETDRLARLNPVALFNYMQEVAIRHGEAVGKTAEALHDAGYIWMMNRVHLAIDRYPRRKDRIRIRTWGHEFKGMYAIREWLAFDSDGDVLARATGRWIMLDGPRRKIIRIPPEMLESYGAYPERAIDDSFERMHPLEEWDQQRNFHVRVSDLDTNQHANSAVYMDWTLESVPPEILQTCELRSVELTYKKECTLGDPVVARAKSLGPDRSAFLHEVRHGESNEVLCLGRSAWSPLKEK